MRVAIRRRHDCEYVNPDAIAQDELGDWNDAETVLRDGATRGLLARGAKLGVRNGVLGSDPGQGKG